MKYPFVRQDGIKDCGVCSLLMIMKYYGGSASKEYLRELTHTTKDGVDSYSLLEAAMKLNFSTKGVKGTLSDLDSSDCPCIAHVVLNDSYQHFIVIYKVNHKKKQVMIADPASSIKKISFSEFEKMSSGVFLLFYPDKKIPVFSKKSHFKNILISFLYNHRKDLFILISLSFLFTFFGIVSSFQFQFLLDQVLSSFSSANLYSFILFFTLFLFMKIWVGLWKEVLLHYLNYLLSNCLILDIYHHILSLPYLYYKNRTTGEIVSRIQDLENVKEFIGRFFVTCCVDLFLILFSYLILWSLNTKLTIILSIVVILIAFIIILVWKVLYPYLKKIREKGSQVNSYLVETITGIETVRSFHLENFIWDKFCKKYRDYTKLSYHTNKLYLYLQSLRNLLEQGGTFLILVVGSYLVIKNELSLGTLLSYYALLSIFLEPIRNLLDIGFSWKDAKISLERIEELYYIQDSLENENGIDSDKILGNIEIKNLNYQYTPKKKILTDINLKINAKDRVLIYGKSGSGKSTLAKILSRMLVIDNGEVLLDNYPLSEYKSASFSKRVCYLSQNDFLFQDSIYHNIYLNSERSYQDFLDICSICKVDEIVKNHPLNYHMLLEENGFNISGGERQRIILARAILKDADLYILDESLNEIDIERERMILINLFEKYPEKTFIVISHRYHNNDLFNRKFEIKEGICHNV